MSTANPSHLSSNITRNKGKQMAASPEPVTDGKPRSADQPGGHVPSKPVSSATTLVSGWTGTTEVAGSSNAMRVDALPAADTGFTNASEILSRSYSMLGDALTVAPTSAEEYRALENLRDEQNRKLRLFYLADHALLIVTVPTAQHEQFHLELNKQMFMEIGGMGLQNDWALVGATAFTSSIGSGSVGEGDSGGRPKSTRPGNGQWPTLVIEAGWTQTLESLRSKKDFWFKDSKHQVKIVILVKGYPNDDNAAAEKRVLLEHWQEPALLERPGATETRLHAAASRDSICLQTINIVWAGPVSYHDASRAMRQDRHNFNVTRGPLRLDFTGLFLRQPAAGGNEHDVVLSDSVLQSYAADVWFR